MSEIDADEPKTAIGSGAAAAGGGTLYVYLVSQVTSDPGLQTVLFHSAPSVTVFVGVGTKYLLNKYFSYMSKKEYDTTFNNTKARLENTLKSQYTSESHKNNMRNQLEELEKLDIDADIQNLKKLVSAKQISNPAKPIQKRRSRQNNS